MCAVSYPVMETAECTFLNGFMVLVVLFYIYITKYTLSGFKIKWSQTQVRRVGLWRAVSDPLPEPPALLRQNTPLPIWNILMWVLWHIVYNYEYCSEVQSFVN